MFADGFNQLWITGNFPGLNHGPGADLMIQCVRENKVEKTGNQKKLKSNDDKKQRPDTLAEGEVMTDSMDY